MNNLAPCKICGSDKVYNAGTQIGCESCGCTLPINYKLGASFDEANSEMVDLWNGNKK